MKLTPEQISQLPWVKALRPLGMPYEARLSRHSDFITWHVDVAFREWPIPHELEQRWKTDKWNNDETWRKRPLVYGDDSGCKPFSCGEVELAARIRKALPHSMWVSEWSTYPHIECWQTFCVKRTELEDREPELWAADNNLRIKSGIAIDILKKRGGHPDVAGWRTQADIVYIEYKGPGDSIKEKQDLWARELIRQNPQRFCYIAAYWRAAA